jgi:predicted oxidoreductase
VYTLPGAEIHPSGGRKFPLPVSVVYTLLRAKFPAMTEGDGRIVFRTEKGYAYFWFTMENKAERERYPIFRIMFNSDRPPLAVNTMGLIKEALGTKEIPEPVKASGNQYELF